MGLLVVAAVGLVAASLMVGKTFYSPAEVLGVILGHDVDGATFTVGRLRLPRAVLAVLTGACFGLGGVTFQTMLRNPLASPDRSEERRVGKECRSRGSQQHENKP